VSSTGIMQIHALLPEAVSSVEEQSGWRAVEKSGGWAGQDKACSDYHVKLVTQNTDK
jgi:hypothetical protein